MGILRTGKERDEDFLKKERLKESRQKKRPRRKRGKNKLLLRLTIPSRRGGRKK
jgi:hypothetical protein